MIDKLRKGKRSKLADCLPDYGNECNASVTSGILFYIYLRNVIVSAVLPLYIGLYVRECT